MFFFEIPLIHDGVIDRQSSCSFRWARDLPHEVCFSNNGICWGIEEGGSKVNIHSSAVHITAHVGNHKIFPFPGLFARLSPFRTTTCLQMAWNSSGEYAARRRLSQKTLPYLLVCRPQPLRSEAPKTKVMFTLYWIAFLANTKSYSV